MSLDGLTAKANTGAGTDVLAGRSVGGKFVSAVMLVDENGVEVGVSNPAKTQDSTASDLINELCLRLAELNDRIGFLSPDTAGRARVNVETGTVATVTTVTTLSNQTSIGGFAANQQMTALTLGSEAALRANVVIT